METEYTATDVIQVFVTMKARPETTMFDWLRMVEELNFAMSDAVRLDDWNSFQIYGSPSDAFEKLPQVCYEVRVTLEAVDRLRECIQKQDGWLLPVGIHVATKLAS